MVRLDLCSQNVGGPAVVFVDRLDLGSQNVCGPAFVCVASFGFVY